MSKVIFYRRGFGLTQQYMADRLGIDRTTYGKKETGKLKFKDNEKEEVVKILKEKDSSLKGVDIFLNA